MCYIYWLHNQKKNNTQVNDAQKADVVTLVYSLIEYGDAYSNTSGSV